MITMLHRSLLEPHPDNPRKDLGDLTELASSIQRSGILQNLTVVPHPDKPGMYRILIGHRRFAASATVGIDELPCSIEEMSMADQIATMLAENIQRNDLTIADQVGGVQMMLDLGVAVKDIAEKTGMSETGVRKRVNIATLPRREMHLAADKGATLLELLEVTKLKSPESQAKVLESFGTNNFQWAVRSAMDDEEKQKMHSEVMPELMQLYPRIKELGDSDTYNGHWTEIWRTHHRDTERKPIPQPEPDEKYAYKDIKYSIILYRENKSWVENKQREKDQHAWLKDRKETAKALNQEAFELRATFIRKYRAPTKQAMMELQERIIAEAFRWKSLTHGARYYRSGDALTMREILAIPYEQDRDKEETFKHELERRRVSKAPALLAYAVCGLAINPVCSDDGYCNTYNGMRKPCEELDAQYRLLTSLGYQMSDFELALQDGSHEFFKEAHS